jgi:hypothetical protein
MKHRIIKSQKLGTPYVLTTIELIPSNEIERKAIANFQHFNVSEEEKELIENYLHFETLLGSILKIIEQNGSIFTLKVANV